MIDPHRIVEQFFDHPLLLTESAAKSAGAFLLTRFAARGGSGSNERPIETIQAFNGVQNPDGSVEFTSPRASRFNGRYRTMADGRPSPYPVTDDGIAIISVIGSLVNRGAWVGASCGFVSYEGIAYQLKTAAKDPTVNAILLDIESPGGEAVGAFELAALVRKVREEKSVIALVNGMAASGAYALASAADRIVTIPTGLVGSIGVVMMHVDISAALEDQGVTPTLIFAGKHKVDGNPYEPLPKSVRAKFQAAIDDVYQMFVSTVAEGRGAKMNEQKVRDTEAAIFMGRDAVAAGLADEIGTFDDVVAALAAPPQTRAPATGRKLHHGSSKTMTEQTQDVSAANETVAPEAAVAPAAPAPEAAAPAAPVAPAADTAAVLAAERKRAAEITAISAQAARLGVTIDAAKAIEDGVAPDALRASVLDTAADRAHAGNSVVAAPPVHQNTQGVSKPAGNGGKPSIVAAAEARAAELTAQRASR